MTKPPYEARSRSGKAVRRHRPSPFAMPDSAFGVMVPARYEQRDSLKSVLLPLGITLNGYGRRLINRWDRDADPFYLMGVRAIAGWLELIHALSMPMKVPPSERAREDPIDHLAFLDLQHHAWFEATLHVGDALSAGLAGHPRAGTALIRPFLESAMVEAWVHGDLDGERLAAYLRYLKGIGGRPRWGDMVRAIFAEDRFAKLPSFKQKVEALYAGSSAALHVRTPQEGLVDWRAGNRAEATYPELVFWFGQLGFAVHRMLTLMVLRFPMVLFPVDLVERFAYSGPMNLFVDDVTSDYVGDGLRRDHADALRQYLVSDDEVTSLMSFYESQDKLTEAQIEEDWAAWVNSRPEWRRHFDVPADQRLTLRKALSAGMIWAGDRIHAHRFIPAEPEVDADALLKEETIADELADMYAR